MKFFDNLSKCKKEHQVVEEKVQLGTGKGSKVYLKYEYCLECGKHSTPLTLDIGKK